MKTTLCLFVLLIFVLACNAPKNAKTAQNEKPKTENIQVSADSLNIPAEFSNVDTIPLADSLAFEEPTDPLEYMSIEEKGMIDEINLLRADPQAYARFIDEYIQTIVADPSKDETEKRNAMNAAGKLIIELQTMEPLPALIPHYKLYQVARSHGKDMIEMKAVSPIGSDESHPFQRIREGAFLDGSENLVAGNSTIRQSVLALLVSGGTDSGYGNNLLDPQWEFVACYEVGVVGEAKNVWVQLFGFSIEEETDEEILNDDAVEEIAIETEVVEKVEKMPEMDFSFMTEEEREMVEEINLLRSNPAGYIQHVEAYFTKHEKEYAAEDKDFKNAVEELKAELKKMTPLPLLQTHQSLYNVAKAHGQDNKSNHRLDHVGTDNSDPFFRVKRAGLKNYIDEKGYFAPNENLVGGEDSARDSVIALLIDSGVSSRGHRKALLHPKWKYVACYKIGLIEDLEELKGQEKDDMNNCWVQLFATD